jgi:hypothetical protein
VVNKDVRHVDYPRTLYHIIIIIGLLVTLLALLSLSLLQCSIKHIQFCYLVVTYDASHICIAALGGCTSVAVIHRLRYASISFHWYSSLIASSSDLS